ncbi:MAG: hypothetical protein QNJ09_14950 [Paracoccaceae bacterium]|nr:hypothetical protein [Paracoccaceae bacterium]
MATFSYIPQHLMNRVQWTETAERPAELLGMVWRQDKELALEIEPHLPWTEAEHAIRIGAGTSGSDFRLIEAVLARPDCTLNLPIERLRRLFPYGIADRNSPHYGAPHTVALRDHMSSLTARINAGTWPADPKGHWPRAPTLERMVAGLHDADHGWALDQDLVEQILGYALAKDWKLNRRIDEMLDGMSAKEVMRLAGDAAKGIAPKGNPKTGLRGLLSELARMNRERKRRG